MFYGRVEGDVIKGIHIFTDGPSAKMGIAMPGYVKLTPEQYTQILTEQDPRVIWRIQSDGSIEKVRKDTP
jgi:hypothetical protein